MKFRTRAAAGIMPSLLPALLLSTTLSLPALGAELSLEGTRAEAERGGYRLINTGELLERHSDEGADMRLVDYLPPEKFLLRMEAAVNGGP